MTQVAQVKVKMNDRVRLEVAHGEVISHHSYGGYSVSVNKAATFVLLYRCTPMSEHQIQIGSKVIPTGKKIYLCKPLLTDLLT